IVNESDCGSTARLACEFPGDSELGAVGNGQLPLPLSGLWQPGLVSAPETDLRAALRTTGAARGFTDEPVSDADVAELIDDARFAPSGGNRQPWRVAVVHDGALRRRLGEMMQPVWDQYVAVGATGRTPFNVLDGLPGANDELR